MGISSTKVDGDKLDWNIGSKSLGESLSYFHYLGYSVRNSLLK